MNMNKIEPEDEDDRDRQYVIPIIEACAESLAEMLKETTDLTVGKVVVVVAEPHPEEEGRANYHVHSCEPEFEDEQFTAQIAQNCNEALEGYMEARRAEEEQLADLFGQAAGGDPREIVRSIQDKAWGNFRRVMEVREAIESAREEHAEES